MFEDTLTYNPWSPLTFAPPAADLDADGRQFYFRDENADLAEALASA
jgi:hypothetical protein